MGERRKDRTWREGPVLICGPLQDLLEVVVSGSDSQLEPADVGQGKQEHCHPRIVLGLVLVLKRTGKSQTIHPSCELFLGMTNHPRCLIQERRITA